MTLTCTLMRPNRAGLIPMLLNLSYNLQKSIQVNAHA